MHLTKHSQTGRMTSASLFQAKILGTNATLQHRPEMIVGKNSPNWITFEQFSVGVQGERNQAQCDIDAYTDVPMRE